MLETENVEMAKFVLTNNVDFSSNEKMLTDFVDLVKTKGTTADKQKIEELFRKLDSNSTKTKSDSNTKKLDFWNTNRHSKYRSLA